MNEREEADRTGYAVDPVILRLLVGAARHFGLNETSVVSLVAGERQCSPALLRLRGGQIPVVGRMGGPGGAARMPFG